MGWPLTGTSAELVGIFGVLVYIGGYLALQLGAIGGQTYVYAGLNILAAGCVLVSLFESFNLSSAVIQITWIVISVVGIVRLALTSLLVRFNAEEQALLDTKLPGLPRHVARRFLRNGAWADGRPGRTLTTEGRPVEDLIYLARGEASVEIGGHVIGGCREGSFVGELTCLSGEPATATVRLESEARFFAIRAERLRALVRRDPGLLRALETGIGADIRRKLIRSNADQTELMARAKAAPGG